MQGHRREEEASAGSKAARYYAFAEAPSDLLLEKDGSVSRETRQRAMPGLRCLLDIDCRHATHPSCARLKGLYAPYLANDTKEPSKPSHWKSGHILCDGHSRKRTALAALFRNASEAKPVTQERLAPFKRAIQQAPPEAMLRLDDLQASNPRVRWILALPRVRQARELLLASAGRPLAPGPPSEAAVSSSSSSSSASTSAMAAAPALPLINDVPSATASSFGASPDVVPSDARKPKATKRQRDHEEDRGSAISESDAEPPAAIAAAVATATAAASVAAALESERDSGDREVGDGAMAPPVPPPPSKKSRKALPAEMPPPEAADAPPAVPLPEASSAVLIDAQLRESAAFALVEPPPEAAAAAPADVPPLEAAAAAAPPSLPPLLPDGRVLTSLPNYGEVVRQYRDGPPQWAKDMVGVPSASVSATGAGASSPSASSSDAGSSAAVSSSTGGGAGMDPRMAARFLYRATQDSRAHSADVTDLAEPDRREVQAALATLDVIMTVRPVAAQLTRDVASADPAWVTEPHRVAFIHQLAANVAHLYDCHGPHPTRDPALVVTVLSHRLRTMSPEALAHTLAAMPPLRLAYYVWSKYRWSPT